MLLPSVVTPSGTSPNLQVGDIVVLQEDNVIPAKWPLVRIVEVHPGNDGLVCVVTMKTSAGVYKRPVTASCASTSRLNTYGHTHGII